MNYSPRHKSSYMTWKLFYNGLWSRKCTYSSNTNDQETEEKLLKAKKKNKKKTWRTLFSSINYAARLGFSQSNPKDQIIHTLDTSNTFQK